MAGREVRGLVEAGADMEVVLRESVLIPRGGGAGRDGPAVAFVNRGDAATWVLGCGCRDTGAGVGTDLVMAGFGACPDAETIGRGGVCTGKGLAFMLLKASLASLFALTLQRTSVFSSGRRERVTSPVSPSSTFLRDYLPHDT